MRKKSDNPYGETAMSDGEATSTTPKTKRKSIEVPQFDSADALMTLVQGHRTATADDNARQFTGEGFKSAGGIDSLPLNTRALMAASLVMSIANDAQGDGDEGKAATAVLGILTPFVGDAQTHATEAAKLSAYEQIAALEGIDARKADETSAQFIARVKKATKG